MAKNEVRIAAGPLQDFTQKVFEKAGLPPQDAAVEAEVLVWANLRGVDSHGVLRIPWYLRSTEAGDMNPRPNIQTLKETPAVLYLDADRAYGPVVTVLAMQKAIEKARQVGIGWALIRNLTHQGAMAYYAQLAAQQGMAGMAIVCSPPNMAPFGAKAAGLHNSPIALAVPAGRHPPLSLDMATSIVAAGKLEVARDKGVPLGEGWALDAEGNPTTDVERASILMPSGGPKGSGLALMFQCLTSLMANNPLVVPVLQGADAVHNQNSVVAAVDIGLFTEVDTFEGQVDALIDELKALPKAEGHDEIFMPGELENRMCEDRQQNGIPLPPGTVQRLREVSQQCGIDLPEGL